MIRSAYFFLLCAWLCAPAWGAGLKVRVLYDDPQGQLVGVYGTLDEEADVEGNRRLRFQMNGQEFTADVDAEDYRTLLEIDAEIENHVYPFANRYYPTRVNYYHSVGAAFTVDDRLCLTMGMMFVSSAWRNTVVAADERSVTYADLGSDLMFSRMDKVDRGRALPLKELANQNYILPFANGGSAVHIVDVRLGFMDNLPTPMARVYAAQALEGGAGTRTVTVYRIPFALLASVPAHRFQDFVFSTPSDYPDMVDVAEMTPEEVEVNFLPSSTAQTTRDLLAGILRERDCRRNLEALGSADAQRPVSSTK